jgi:uncharacterized protein involved in exopolysaccharide biosynthesis
VTDQELERRVRKVAIDHAETRWLTLQLDDDVKEIAAQLRTMDAKLDEQSARFDALESELRSVNQLVGQLLKRLGETAVSS